MSRIDLRVERLAAGLAPTGATVDVWRRLREHPLITLGRDRTTADGS